MKDEIKNGLAILAIIFVLIGFAFAVIKGDKHPCNCKTKEECAKLPRYCWRDE